MNILNGMHFTEEVWHLVQACTLKNYFTKGGLQFHDVSIEGTMLDETDEEDWQMMLHL